MPPPEVWGPAVWILFHTLCEKVNPNTYPLIRNSMFSIIVQICKYLPCPDCAKDASNILAKVNINNLNNKDDFKNMFYMFHNYVNVKKRKPLFNYMYIGIYKNMDLNKVISNFISKYNTRGNMKLLTESFQRGFVVKNFLKWFYSNTHFFVTPVIQTAPQPNDIQKEDLQPDELIQHEVQQHEVPKHELQEHDSLEHDSQEDELQQHELQKMSNEDITNEDDTNEEKKNEDETNEDNTNEDDTNEEETIDEMTNEVLSENPNEKSVPSKTNSKQNKKRAKQKNNKKKK